MATIESHVDVSPGRVLLDDDDTFAAIATQVTHEAAVVHPRATPWELHYIALAVVLDSMIAFVAGAAAFLLWPGSSEVPTPYFVASVAMPAIWVVALALTDSYDRSRLSVGPEEYNRVALAAFGLLASVALLDWATEIDVSRPFTATALAIALVGTTIGRFGLRKYVHRQRRHGRFTRRTLLVGQPDSVADLAAHLRRYEYQGFVVVGACHSDATAAPVGVGIRDLGSIDDIADAVRQTGADNVAITRDHGLSPAQLQTLTWQVERLGVNLFVAPSIMEVAGPRLSIHPVEGVSLMSIQYPTLRGAKRVVKDVYDVALSAVALIVLAPLLAAIALAIKIDSPGPVLFRQTRVGRLGEPFSIVKFRSMVPDAEARRHEVEGLNEGAGPLFKTRNDPRVTRVGAMLRRTSLDELPQLWNVFRGDMSLVGPRPFLPGEVVTFDPTSRRRLFVKPGITGMWQISGRSDLSWDESVRADIRYVENWTLGLDALILWKTLGVVARGDGAY